MREILLVDHRSVGRNRGNVRRGAVPTRGRSFAVRTVRAGRPSTCAAASGNRSQQERGVGDRASRRTLFACRRGRSHLSDCRAHKHLLTLALECATGKVLWERDANNERLEEIHHIGSHAQASPAADSERVVSFFGSSGLCCYDHCGKLLWKVPLGPFKNNYGAGQFADSRRQPGDFEPGPRHRFVFAGRRQTERQGGLENRPLRVSPRLLHAHRLEQRRPARDYRVRRAPRLRRRFCAGGELWTVRALRGRAA